MCGQTNHFVSPKTVARWLVESLEKSGINLKAHLTRSAFTFSARCKALLLTKIVKGTWWANFSTFEKFYDKPVNDINFGSNILIHFNVVIHVLKYKFFSWSRFTWFYTFCMVSTYLTIDNIVPMSLLRNWSLKSHLNTYQGAWNQPREK